ALGPSASTTPATGTRGGAVPRSRPRSTPASWPRGCSSLAQRSRNRRPGRNMATVTPGKGKAGTSDAAAERAARIAGFVGTARRGGRGGRRGVGRGLTPLLWHGARAEGLTSEEAADVVQTTWLELVRRLHEIRSPGALTSWLVTATRREAWRTRELSRRQLPGGAGRLGAAAQPRPPPGPQPPTRPQAPAPAA